ncbi:interferon regulatory factor 7 [Leptodactylus fuscus]|uniref:interferon regulatory factor 7 n=1 Tax=Leptodactylus fuscus TaxID=238119 RepID=UPI003F4EDF28
MPRRERELFGPWLIRQINSNHFEGVLWLDEDRTLFRLPWKHLNMKNADERDYGIFKAWAICSGRYHARNEDPPTWKTNFRCALNQVHYQGQRMFSEVKDNSSDQRAPHKIYRFNGVHDDLPTSNPNVAVDQAPSNSEDQSLFNELNQDAYALRISPDCVLASPFPRPEEPDVIEELMRNILLDPRENSIQQVLNLSQDDPPGEPHVDQVFRMSQHDQWANSQLSCVVNGHEQVPQEQPTIHIPAFCEPYPQYQMPNMYQNGYPHVAVNQVFSQMSAFSHFHHPTTVLNGFASASQEHQVAQHNGYQQKSARDVVSHVVQNGFQQEVPCVEQDIKPSPIRQDPPRQSFVQETQNTLMNQHGAHDMAYRAASNGYPQDELRADQGITSDYPYHTTNEECARSSPDHDLPAVNGSGQVSATETQQRKMPPITSWEVTIYYRGKEVLKQNVSKKFIIKKDVDDVQTMEDTDTVQFPSTDVLVDQVQIKYTNDILSCVGNGLSLEVNPENYKVYATRMGKSRVFWSLSRSLETQETSSQDMLLTRDEPTEIFDFNQFWEEFKSYKCHRRPSPDYTIYMTFAQLLFEPVMKKLVLVKLVPNLCTFLHQAAQQSGASSLHSEVISLQISNGSSFNSVDLNGPCLMDLDLHDLF